MTALRSLDFDRLYGWIAERVLQTGAKRSLEKSLETLRSLRGERDFVRGD